MDRDKSQQDCFQNWLWHLPSRDQPVCTEPLMTGISPTPLFLWVCSCEQKCIWMCGTTRGPLSCCPSGAIHFCCCCHCETGSLWLKLPSRLGLLPSEPQGSSCLCLTSTRIARVCSHTWLVMWVLGSALRPLCPQAVSFPAKVPA